MSGPWNQTRVGPRNSTTELGFTPKPTVGTVRPRPPTGTVDLLPTEHRRFGTVSRSTPPGTPGYRVVAVNPGPPQSDVDAPRDESPLFRGYLETTAFVSRNCPRSAQTHRSSVSCCFVIKTGYLRFLECRELRGRSKPYDAISITRRLAVCGWCARKQQTAVPALVASGLPTTVYIRPTTRPV